LTTLSQRVLKRFNLPDLKLVNDILNVEFLVP